MTGVKTCALGLILLATSGTVGLASDFSGSSLYYTDAYLNMSDGGYKDESDLTAGDARPWYTSPVVEKFYGGEAPDASERTDFVHNVFVRTKQTFTKSGLNLSLTNNPKDPVPHTLSVVSGTDSPLNTDAVGITNIGGNGFTFIDGLKYADTLDQLEWAVAHNVAHELMHAFGGGHHDTTGQYLDAAVTKWETLVNPNATFSPAAVAELRTKDFRNPYGIYASYMGGLLGNQEILARGGDQGSDVGGGHLTTLAAPVPEPASLAFWGLVGFGGCLLRTARRRRAA